MQSEQIGTSTKMPGQSIPIDPEFRQSDPRKKEISAIRYTYFVDNPDTRRKGVPEAWTTTDKANGKMYGSYPTYSHIPGTRDEEPVRYGPFVIDLDTGATACRDAQVIIGHFEEVYGVLPDQWMTFLSGKKGVHLELPAIVLGTEGGHPLLPITYKRLALDVQGATGVKLDMSMYCMGTGKPYRRANIKRPDSGTYKVQVDLDGLSSVAADYEEYLEVVSQPGEKIGAVPPARCEVLCTKVKQYTIEAEEAWEKLKDIKPLSSEAKAALRNGMPPCVQHMQQAVTGQATFNEVAMALTAYTVTIGMSEQDFLQASSRFIENYTSTSLTSLDKRYQNCSNRYRTMLANGYAFSCGPVLSLKFPGSAFECSECPHYTRRPEDIVVGFTDQQQACDGEPVDIDAFLSKTLVKKDYVMDIQDAKFHYKDLLIARHILSLVAPPNGGKTTLMFFHIAPAMVRAGCKVHYIDMDSPASDHSVMFEFAQAHGILWHNPETNPGESIDGTIKKFEVLSKKDITLEGYVFVFDTLKKLLDVLSKSSARDLFKMFRRLTNRGASIVTLGHANKYPDKDGNLVFEGVGDLKADVDEMIYLYSARNDITKEQIVTTYPDKVRGLFDQISFSINAKREVARLPNVIDTKSKVIIQQDDTLNSIIENIKEGMQKGLRTQSHIVTYVIAETGVGRNKIIKILDLYSDEGFEGRVFNMERGEKNSKIFTLLGRETGSVSLVQGSPLKLGN